ncbi:MAG: glycosyltransferase family 4 protein [Acidimicrobiales bacterium]
MRVLMLPEFYPPVIGGLELHAQRLSVALRDRGHDVSVCTLAGPDGPGARTDEHGLTVRSIDGWRRHLGRFYEKPELAFHPTAPDPGVIASLRQVLAEVRPDVVHAHGWILHSALSAVPGSGARLVATLHDFGLVCPRRNLLHQGVELCDGPSLGRCLTCAPEQYGVVKATPLVLGHHHAMRRRNGRVDRYLAVSTAVRDAVLAGGASAGARVDVVPNFVDIAAVQAGAGAPRPAWVPATGAYVLFVGAVTGFKGVGELLSVWATRRPDAELVLVGTRRPDTPTELPPGVRLVDAAPHAEVVAAMHHAAVAVTPSVGPDACPTTVLESMAAGAPTIGTRTGGIPDLIVDGESGLLVPPGDVAALGDAVDHVLATPALAAHLAAGGRARAERFTAPVVAAQVEAVYREVVGRSLGPVTAEPAPAPEPVPASEPALASPVSS